jgi:hypothetical protein
MDDRLDSGKRISAAQKSRLWMRDFFWSLRMNQRFLILCAGLSPSETSAWQL